MARYGLFVLKVLLNPNQPSPNPITAQRTSFLLLQLNMISLLSFSSSTSNNRITDCQGVVGASTLEAMEEAVRKYKALARHVEPHTDQAKDIIRRLVQLRMKLFQAKVRWRNISHWDSSKCFNTAIALC